MPFLNRAVLQMPIEFYTPNENSSEAAVAFGTDGEQFYGLASIVMQMFEQSDTQVVRLYLHSIMHCIFTHMFTYERLQTQYWDLAADMAVENVILSLDWKRCEIDGDDIRRRVLQETLDKCGRGNAETIYAYLCSHEKERNVLLRYAWMFRQDRHDIWVRIKRRHCRIRRIWNSSGTTSRRIRNLMRKAMRRLEEWSRGHFPVSSH